MSKIAEARKITRAKITTFTVFDFVNNPDKSILRFVKNIVLVSFNN